MLRQAINRIDHIAVLVHPENFDSYVHKFSNLLNITFDAPIYNESAGLMAALAWDSGIELVAPTRQEGRFWEKLLRCGEGSITIVFGVSDLDEALERVKVKGVKSHEWQFTQDTPWLSRFRLFREAKLEAFGPEFGLELTLSQIEPRGPEDDGACILHNPLNDPSSE